MDSAYRCNISVKSNNSGYVILFTRENKKPHIIYSKAKNNSSEYESLLAGCSRAFRLAKTTKVIFRTNDIRLINFFQKKPSQLNENEKEVIKTLKDKKLTLEIRGELSSHNAAIQREFAKRLQKEKEKAALKNAAEN